MKVRELMEECKKRPTKRDCYECPYEESCNYIKGYLSDLSPSQYDKLQEILEKELY